MLINAQKEMHHTKFIPPSMALSSEACSSEGSPHKNSSEFLSTTLPMMCLCENQLAHYNWDGRIHPDLPLPCKRVVGIRSRKQAVAIPMRSQDDTERESKHGLVVDPMVTDILTRLSIYTGRRCHPWGYNSKVRFWVARWGNTFERWHTSYSHSILSACSQAGKE